MSGVGAEESAGARFWRTPELVEKLLDFLDGRSTLILARCHDLTNEVLQRSTVWNKEVRRTCPDGSNLHWATREVVTINKKKLMPLFGILKMSKDPAQMKLIFLEVICERFPPDPEIARTGLGEPHPQYVKVCFSCPHNDHSVSALGFLILEEVELACGSSPNLVIDTFDLSCLDDPMMSAVSRRASCQEVPLKEFKVWACGFNGGTIVCNKTQKAESLLTIARSSEVTSFEGLIVVGDIKKEGWAALGKVADLHERDTEWRTFNVTSRREHMLTADRKDLRKIWDAMWGGMFGNSWFVTSWRRWSFLVNEDDGRFYKEEGEEEWERLMEVLDMNQEEWEAKFVPLHGLEDRFDEYESSEEDESSEDDESSEEDESTEEGEEKDEDKEGDENGDFPLEAEKGFEGNQE